MSGHGFFGHTGSDGSSVGDRVRRTGYDFCKVAEAIAQGEISLGAVLQGWMASRPHRQILLSREAEDFGLVRGAGNRWVLVMARPGC